MKSVRNRWLNFPNSKKICWLGRTVKLSESCLIINILEKELKSCIGGGRGNWARPCGPCGGIRGCLTSPFGYSLSRRCFPEVTSSACEAHRTLERLTWHFSGVTRKLPGVKMTKKNHHPRLDLGSWGSRAHCRTRGPFCLLPRLRLEAVDLKCSSASLLCSRLLSQEDALLISAFPPLSWTHRIFFFFLTLRCCYYRLRRPSLYCALTVNKTR